MSRSAFHDRFVHFVGQPPMQYLMHWRMQLAAGMLRDSNTKLVDVALDVGYESEAAFSRAFKRIVGTSPRAWRMTHGGFVAGAPPPDPSRSAPSGGHRDRRSSSRT